VIEVAPTVPPVVLAARAVFPENDDDGLRGYRRK
jgi:hypothetical protein